MRPRLFPVPFAIFPLLLIGCGSDSTTEPEGLTGAEVAGTYTLTALSFDPQGTLPQADILARIPAANRPTLNLAAQGGAQIVFLDPITGLTRTVDGTFGTTATEVVIDFGTGQGHAVFLLSRNMPFTYSATGGSLTFDGDAPDGVSRDVLLFLVPEWESEQLFDPTPGSLRVVFTRAGG